MIEWLVVVIVIIATLGSVVVSLNQAIGDKLEAITVEVGE